MATLPGEQERPVPKPSSVVPDVGATGFEGRSSQFLSSASGDMQEATKYLEKAKNDYDELVVQDASNKLNTERLKMYGEVVNTRGADAANPKFIPDSVGKFRTASDAIESQLTDDNQKRLFSKHRDMMMRQQSSLIYEHAAKETMQHGLNVYATAIEQSKQAASQFDDPGPVATADVNRNNIDTELLNGYRAIAGKARLEGKSPEQVELEKIGLRDEIYGNRILRVSMKDPLKAEAMYELVRDDLSPKAKLQIENHLKSGVEDQLARRGGMQTVSEIIDKNLTVANKAQDYDLSQIVKSMKQNKISSADVTVDTENGKRVKGVVNINDKGIPEFVSDVQSLEAKVGVLPPVNSKVDYALLAKPIEDQARAYAEKVRPGDMRFSDQTVAHAKTYLNKFEQDQQAVNRSAWEKVEQALFNVNGKGTNPSTVPELVAAVGEETLRNLPAGALHGVMVGLEANEKRKTGNLKLDPMVYTGLIQKIWSGQLKDNWELASYIGRGLDPAHLNQLRQEVVQANQGSPVLQDRVRKTYNALDNIWKASPSMALPQYQGLIETQKAQWLEGLRSEMAGVAEGTPQQREATQLEIINRWSSPEKIREYQPDVVEALKADRTRISDIQRSVPAAIPIMSKDPVEMKRLYNEAAPGQQLIVWDMYEGDGKTKKKKPDWAVITKPTDAKVSEEGVRLTPADRMREARRQQRERVQGAE